MTYCIAIEQALVSGCPLPKGRCYWQHRVTKVCCYTEQDLTPEEYAERVGTYVPEDKEVQLFTARLRTEMRD